MMVPSVMLPLLVAAAATFNPFDGPTPMVVFIQSNPWAMVIGADTPRVAIYDSGEAIFTKTIRDDLVYHRVLLDQEALADVRERLDSVLALDDLKPYYNIARGATDQPKAMFYVRDGEREVSSAVYGLMGKSRKRWRWPFSRRFDGWTPRGVPTELLELHQWLCELDFRDSEEWTPPFVEVMLWDYSHAPGPSIHWPEEWPGLESDRAIQRGNSYSIFLDGAAVPELRAFLARRESKGAVELDGKKWTTSYRYTFPGEPDWRKALAVAYSKGCDGH